MFPPLPPSPPLGPPFGTNFSRRKAMQPCPPFPARTVILASSINIGGETRTSGTRPIGRIQRWYFELQAGSFDRLNADEAAGVAFVFECDDAGDFCKEGIVSSDADIHARFELRSTLTDENGSTGDQLTTKAFHTQPLGMTVAAIS